MRDSKAFAWVVLVTAFHAPSTLNRWRPLAARTHTRRIDHRPHRYVPYKVGGGEGGIRVPWVARWPGKVKAGTTCREPIISVDLYPTRLTLAAWRKGLNAPMPANRQKSPGSDR